MDAEQFRKAGKEAIDFIVDYVENIRLRDPLPNVQQGYLHSLLPNEAPVDGEKWEDIKKDFDTVIMDGVTHWCSPMFNAYFPCIPSYPSILGEIFAAGLSTSGFNWIASPSNTELEVIVTDWMAKLINIPEHFLATSPGPGGGCIHTSASEGLFVALLAAKHWTITRLQAENPELDAFEIMGKLVAYSSDQSNSSIEKSGKLGSVQMRLLPVDHKGSLTFETFKEAVESDLKKGLIPFYAVITLGSTSFCAFDELGLIGPYCNKQNIWVHADAAFAGNGFMLEEWRHLMNGIECSDSINLNAHKWISVSFDCTIFWIKDRHPMIESMNVDSIYLKDVEDAKTKHAPEYRHWEVSLGRRFRSLKLWFVLRTFGVEGIKKGLRQTCELAQRFANTIGKDQRFTIFHPITMSLVCFNLNGDSDRTRKLLQLILSERKLFMVGTELHGVYYIRYAVTSFSATHEDIDNACQIIFNALDRLK